MKEGNQKSKFFVIHQAVACDSVHSTANLENMLYVSNTIFLFFKHFCILELV